MEDYGVGEAIIQLVLGWNAAPSFGTYWTIASWNCCPSGTANYSTPLQVNPGDTIYGTFKSTCREGTISCSKLDITTENQTFSQSTTLRDTPSEGQTLNWAGGGALEVNEIVQRSDYPPNQSVTFSNLALYDYNFNKYPSPGWVFFNDVGSGSTPQYNYRWTKPWPALFGQVGPYGVQSPEEIADMANDGFRLALLPYEGKSSEMAAAIQQNHVKYIDAYLWGRILKTCKRLTTGEWDCSNISQEQVQTILGEVIQHLALTSQDSSIVGYWILDDWPNADIHELLERIHDLVRIANQSSVFPRPTICGFGGLLSQKATSDAPFVTNTSYFDRAITNFSPNACDVVALYPYANEGNDPRLVDWSMSSLLPLEFQLLEARGWNPQKEPLIGVPQTFSYERDGVVYHTLPTEADVAAQSAAYCKAGAIALVPYTWDDGWPWPKTELYNSPDLVRGLQEGTRECQRNYWSAASR